MQGFSLPLLFIVVAKSAHGRVEVVEDTLASWPEGASMGIGIACLEKNLLQTVVSDKSHRMGCMDCSQSFLQGLFCIKSPSAWAHSFCKSVFH